MPRKQKKYHFIYKTTCIITNRFYYGMHSTHNLNDGYVGSGKRLWYSVNKHGKENHKLKILEYLDSRELLKEREKELITEDMLKDPMCMNLQLGGGGGFVNEKHMMKCSLAGAKRGGDAIAIKLKTDSNFRKQFLENNLKGQDSCIGEKNGFHGKTHSKETKEKMKLSHKGKHVGKLNSQYGKCWIYNIEKKQSIRIKQEELDSYLNRGWLKGRKLKFK